MKLLEAVHPGHPVRRLAVAHPIDDQAHVPDAPVAMEAGAHAEERRRRAHRQGRGERAIERGLESGSIRLLSTHAAHSTRFPWPLFCPGVSSQAGKDAEQLPREPGREPK